MQPATSVGKLTLIGASSPVATSTMTLFSSTAAVPNTQKMSSARVRSIKKRRMSDGRAIS